MIWETKFVSLILIAFTLAFVLAPFYIGLLFKFNIRRISKPDLDDKLPDRSLKLGTPVMGGFLIVAVVLLLGSAVLRKSELYLPLLLTLVFGGFLGAIDEFINTIGRKGFSFAVREAVDEVVSKNAWLWKIYKILLIPWDLSKELFRMLGSSQRGFSTHTKVICQILIASVGSFYLFWVLGSQELWLPLLGKVALGYFYPLILIFLALYFANALGVTDGMDGLSAGLHSLSFISLGVLALLLGKPEAAYWCALIVGAELAFLYFNVHPARVEMSDVGTLPLGMALVIIAAYLQREVALLGIGGMFIAELSSSFIQVMSVKLRGKRVFLMAPLHHHFEKLGWHETKVTPRLWLWHALMCLSGILIGLM